MTPAAARPPAGPAIRFAADFALLLAALGIVHAASLLLRHVAYDDFALWHVDDRDCCSSHVHTIVNVVLARPLGALLLNLHSMWIRDGDDVQIARLVSIALCALTAAVFTAFLRRMGVSRALGLMAALAVFTVPGWYFYVLHLCYFAFWLAPAFLVALLAHALHGRNRALLEATGRAALGRRMALQVSAAALCLAVLFLFYQTTPTFFVVYTAAYVLFAGDRMREKAIVVGRDVAALLAGAVIYFVAWKAALRPLIKAASPHFRPFLEPGSELLRVYGNLSLPRLDLPMLQAKGEMLKGILLKSLAFPVVSIEPARGAAAVAGAIILAAILLRLLDTLRRQGRLTFELPLGAFTVIGLGALASLAGIASPEAHPTGGAYRILVGSSAVGALAAVWAVAEIGRFLGAWLGAGRLGAQIGAGIVAALACVAAGRTIYDHALNSRLEIAHLQWELEVGRVRHGEIGGVHLIRPGNDVRHMSFTGRPVLASEFFHPRTAVPKGSFTAVRYALGELGYPVRGLTPFVETTGGREQALFFDDYAACERIYAELDHLVINMNDVAVVERVAGVRNAFLFDSDWTVRFAAYREGFERIRDRTMTQPSNAFDRRAHTVWSSDGRVFLWFDFGRPVSVSAVRLAAPRPADLPARLSVRASADGQAWVTWLDAAGERLAATSGAGDVELPIAGMPPSRYFVVDLTAAQGARFVLSELRLVDEVERANPRPVMSDFATACR